MMLTDCLLCPRHYLRHVRRSYLTFLPSQEVRLIHLRRLVLCSLVRRPPLRARTYLTTLSSKIVEERDVSTISYLLNVGHLTISLLIFVQNGTPPVRVAQRCLHLGAVKLSPRHPLSSAPCSHQSQGLPCQLWILRHGNVHLF